MTETEVKILEIDAVVIQDKLLGLGAEKIFTGEMFWTLLDFPDRRLKRDGSLLRLRQKGDTVELTFKKLITTTGAKISEEREVVASNYEDTLKILESIGLEQKRRYPLRKLRTSYTLDKFHIDIDTLSPIPTFMEIEGPDIASIHGLAEKLGYSEESLKPWGLSEVFDHYRKLGIVE